MYLNKNLKKGSIVSPEDITILRPVSGIPASEYYEILGKKLTRDVTALEALDQSDFSINEEI